MAIDVITSMILAGLAATAAKKLGPALWKYIYDTNKTSVKVRLPSGETTILKVATGTTDEAILDEVKRVLEARTPAEEGPGMVDQSRKRTSSAPKRVKSTKRVKRQNKNGSRGSKTR